MAEWWRRYGTVRLQTTLVAVVVTGLALGIAWVAVMRSVRADITSRIRGEAAEVVGRIVADLNAGVPPQGIAFEVPVGAGFVPSTIRVVNRDTGKTVAAIAPMVALDNPNGKPAFPGLPPEPTDALILSEEPQIKFIKDVTTARGDRLRVIAGSPASIVSQNTAALRIALTAGFPALAVVVGLVTWFLTGRSLRPVERIRAEVEEISAHTLDRRVPTPETQDEVARLAHTMNRMLDRLEASATRQREFVSDASHELRSPIAAIRSEIEVAMRDPVRADWMSVGSATLAENERLERLVGDLLTLARLDEGAVAVVEDVDLEDLVREESARLRDPRVHSAIAPVRVRGNREQLGRAVRNLIENAARFSGDRIDVDVGVEDGIAVVTVDDDGPGIPAADRQRVFERFTRLDEGRARNHGGAGLGLALVRAIVHAHGGAVDVVDSDAGGARFIVRLPRGEP